MARTWKKSKTFCRKCGKWKSNIRHRDCPAGEPRGLIFVDISNFEEGCNKCNNVWALEDSVFYCGCGNIQKTEYVDEVVQIQQGDQVIGVDPDSGMVYVLTRSGTVVVGGRSYLNVSYED